VRPTAAATPWAKGKADLLRAFQTECASANVESGVKPRKGMLEMARCLTAI
jgi:hypothetical protein